MRKILSMHHLKVNIHRLYLSRSNGARGLTQLKLSYKISTIGLFQYLNLSGDWMLQLSLKDKKEKGSHSVDVDVDLEIDVDLETEFGVKIKNTENARKLKEIAKEKGEKGDTEWKSKPLHEQHPL